MRTLIFPSADAIHRLPPPDDIPSDRTTRRLLPDDDSSGVIELVTGDILVEPARPSRPPRAEWLGAALRVVAAGVLLFGVVAFALDGRAPASPPLAPRIAWPHRTTITEPTAAAAPAPPRRRCVVSGPPRFVASRARIDAGLDVGTTSTGFVVALAPTAREAYAVRLEGAMLRAAESVRVPGAAPIRHVGARAKRDLLDVAIDTTVGRTLVLDPDAEVAPLRVDAAGSFVVARTPHATRALWMVPREDDAAIQSIRVARGRAGGGAFVAAKRGKSVFVGALDASATPAGPLAEIRRAPATIGTPAIAATDDGALVAWAERAPGARAWSIMVAGADVSPPRVVAPGISPSLAVLPNGGVLVAYADGPTSAHRIVVQRFARDLTPEGDGVIVGAPPGGNAGQPALDVRGDGSVLVAWFAVLRGQPPSVFATPLSCDVAGGPT